MVAASMLSEFLCFRLDRIGSIIKNWQRIYFCTECRVFDGFSILEKYKIVHIPRTCKTKQRAHGVRKFSRLLLDSKDPAYKGMQVSACVMLSAISDATTYSSFNTLHALHICCVTTYEHAHLSWNVSKAGISDSFVRKYRISSSHLVRREEDCVIEQIAPHFWCGTSLNDFVP